LHHALQKTLGSHAQQQGSKVEDDWLRFDFTNLSPVTAEQLDQIEQDVIGRISDSQAIRWDILPLDEARQTGAMMLFGEKYPDPVRMVSMGQFSKELCGGTHLNNTGEVGPFDILGEEAVAAGTRRITALTGEKAREHIDHTQAALRAAASALSVEPAAVAAAAKPLAQRVRDLKKQLAGSGKPSEPQPPLPATQTGGDPSYLDMKHALRKAARSLAVAPLEVPFRIEALIREARELEKQLHEQQQAGSVSAEVLLDQAEQIDGTRVIVAETPSTGPNIMRQLIDQLRRKAAPCAVLLAARQGEGKVTLVAGISRDLVEQGISAGDWVRDVAKIVGGGGGGKADMAQAGGKSPEKLPEALEKALAWIAAKLA
jgi:alanyl-tRNA synthetase